MLRHCLLIICLLIAYNLFGQNKVNFLSDGPNTLSLRVTAYGKKAKEAIENAEQAAVRAILFRGIPGSNQVENPLIGVNEEKIQKEHKSYFKELFRRKALQQFYLIYYTRLQVLQRRYKKEMYCHRYKSQSSGSAQ